MSAGSRICPQCRERTDERLCPQDGFTTVEAHLYADDGSDPLLGRVLGGRYQVMARIGRGGMGSVYRANQLNMGNRPVALKVIHPQLATDLELVQRFQQEARAASQLRHSNTIRVYDFGEAEGGSFYIVTELLEGESLAERIRREGRLPLADAIQIALQALRSLAEAHEHGIVHRDIKPDNLFLNRVREEMVVKVMDFGIAKVLDEGTTPPMTRTGGSVGTPAYMAPEQALGKRVDARSDLYAVGLVLYEMLEGVRPFRDTEALKVMNAHVQRPVPPLTRRDATKPLCDLVQRCLNKHPLDRPSSADALVEELEAVLAGLDQDETLGQVLDRQGLTPTDPVGLDSVPEAAALAEMWGSSGLEALDIPPGRTEPGPPREWTTSPQAEWTTRPGSTAPPAPRSARRWAPWAAGSVAALVLAWAIADRPPSEGPAVAPGVVQEPPVAHEEGPRRESPPVATPSTPNTRPAPDAPDTTLTPVTPPGQPPPQSAAQVRLASVPSGARVVDAATGVVLGQTPLAVEVGPGGRKVQLQRRGYRSRAVSLLREPEEVSVTLTPRDPDELLKE